MNKEEIQKQIVETQLTIDNFKKRIAQGKYLETDEIRLFENAFSLLDTLKFKLRSIQEKEDGAE